MSLWDKEWKRLDAKGRKPQKPTPPSVQKASLAERLAVRPGSGDSVINFRKYAGKTVAEIADIDGGLSYLDWLVGQTWLDSFIKRDIESLLSREVMSRELRRELEEVDDDDIRD